MTQYPEDQLQVEHHFAGGVYAKEVTIMTTDGVMRQHRHHYDHMSILTKGSVYVVTDDQEKKLYNAPAVMTIPAGVNHYIVPVTVPVKWYCIHATDCTDPVTVDSLLSEEI